MAQHHIFVGSFRRPQRITTNLKVHFRGVTGTAGYPFLVYSDVAVITVFIGYGVTDLAGKVTKVLLVLGVTLGVGPYICVAVLALD